MGWKALPHGELDRMSGGICDAAKKGSAVMWNEQSLCRR